RDEGAVALGLEARRARRNRHNRHLHNATASTLPRASLRAVVHVHSRAPRGSGYNPAGLSPTPSPRSRREIVFLRPKLRLAGGPLKAKPLPPFARRRCGHGCVWQAPSNRVMRRIFPIGVPPLRRAENICAFARRTFARRLQPADAI